MKNKYGNVYDIIRIVTGCTLMAAAINLFLEPEGMVIGGVTGIGIMTRELFSIPMWLTNIIINIPLFIAGIKVIGMRLIKKTLFATVFLSAALAFTEFLPKVETDIILSTIFGGVLSGMGLGIIMAANTTTGGTDLLAMIVKKFFPEMSIARIMLYADVIIICGGFFVFGSNSTMYAIVCAYLTSKIIDAILEGIDYAKAAFIVSDYAEEIGKEIMTRLDRGVTAIGGKGLYTKKNKNMLICVVGKREIGRLKAIAEERDRSAFIFITDVREVLGLRK